MRNAQLMGSPGGQVAGVEVIGAVDDEVSAAQLRQGGVRCEARELLDGALGVEGVQGRGGGFGFGLAYGRCAVDDLAVQVGEGDEVVVEKQDAPHARACQVEQGRRAEAAGADDGDCGSAKPFLCGGAPQSFLACVA